MENLVTVARGGGIAVVTIDNPPVNALSFRMRGPLRDALAELDRDDGVQAIVLACAGRTFVSGADISEFGTPVALAEPTLPQLCAQLEALSKPVVAAIHGSALGGGLELALACHYRVADKAAKVGLPEVKLGLIPGSGGTVRLPRLTGPEKAVELIVSGNPVGAAKALEYGIIDSVAEGDLVAAAIAFAKDKAGQVQHKAVRDRDDLLKAANLEAFDAAVAALTKKSRGLEAPAAAAQAVRNAITMPFDEALKAERETFLRLVAGDQSRAQRHLFFAEREAAKVEGIGKETPARPVKKVGVIGAGLMGGGIAMAFANGGFEVVVLDMSDEALDRGFANIEKTYASSVARGSLSDDERQKRLSRLARATDYRALADCDLIIEAVFEDMAVKHDVFRKLDEVAKQGAVLATNTSYLDVNEIAAATSRPRDVLGLHFFSPANVMKLLEIVRAAKTAPDAIATALDVARKIGKVSVVVGVCHGFVGNRMLTARGNQLEPLLLEGASPQQVDRVFTDFGFPMGPFAMMDMAGLDIGWRKRKALGQRALIADALADEGHFGQKTGRGFYRYAEGSRTPEPDAEVARLIEETAKAHGIERREISDQEILERTLYPLVNEGARILEEGIAARASDIDVVWVNGYGFPIGEGGPMFWAGLEGLSKIVERLDHWRGKTGEAVFEPAALLRQLAAEGGSFAR